MLIAIILRRGAFEWGWGRLGAVLNLVASLPLRVAVATSASIFVLVDAAGFLAYSRAFVPTVVVPLVLGAAVGVVAFSFKACFCLRVWGYALVSYAGGDCCA